MKKVILLLFCIIISIFSGCVEKKIENSEEEIIENSKEEIYEAECLHKYETIIVDATCANEGFDIHICSLCGDSYKDNIMEPTKKHVGVGECASCGLDFYDDVVAYIKKNGTYSNSTNSYVILDENVYPYSCLWSYDINTSRLAVSFTKKTTDSVTFFIVYYNNANGVYRWGMHFEITYANQSFQMEGVYDARTIFRDTDHISYAATTFPDYLVLEAQELAADCCYLNVLFFRILLEEANSDIMNWGYTNISIED